MILQIVPAVSEEASGPSYSVIRLCESIIAQGKELNLATLDWSPIKHIHDFVHTFPLGIGPRNLGNSPAMYKWLKSKAKLSEIKIIHNHSLWMMPNVYAGWTACRFKIPMVVSPRGSLTKWSFNHGSVLKKYFWPLLQKPSLSSTVCFHVTSLAEYEDIRGLGFCEPVAVIPNGVDLPVLSKKITKPVRTLLFLGRIHPQKGVDILLKAWSIIQDQYKDWKLDIVGPDNDGYLYQMKDLSRKLKLKRVEFFGPLYGNYKWETYKNADLFVLPTHSENFGMSVAEALASGIPTIVSKGAPWKGLISEGAGWWIDNGIESLVACLKIALAASNEDLQQMGLRGRAWMSREYSWEHIGHEMSIVYNWIINGGVKPNSVIEH